MKNDATSLIHMDANATVSRITIVCHLSILLCLELDTNPGRKGGRGRGGGSTFDMVISMKPLRILLNNIFTSGIEHLQSVLAVSSHPHLPSVYHIPPSSP